MNYFYILEHTATKSLRLVNCLEATYQFEWWGWEFFSFEALHLPKLKNNQWRDISRKFYEDFKSDGYYSDMKSEALNDLINSILNYEKNIQELKQEVIS